MCLLTVQPKGTTFDKAFIQGVYNRNSDGIGVMYSENNTLHIVKFVPKTEKEFEDFFNKHISGRACAWHARMRTHGDIDMTNCHPYEVISKEEGYPLYMAHNGVLSFGNEKDETKSDTWHYIQDVLRPMLLKNPTFFMTEAFKDLIEAHIGRGNKFVLMDAYGNTVTVNDDAGVEYNGAWLSNTYAWDTTGTTFERPAVTQHNAWWPSYPHTYPYTSSYTRSASSLFPARKADIPELSTPVVDYFGAESYDFASELFTALNYSDFDQLFSDLSFENAVAYYNKVGDEQAWGLIEAIDLGSYTEDELRAEFNGYGLLDEVGVNQDVEQDAQAEFDFPCAAI